MGAVILNGAVTIGAGSIVAAGNANHRAHRDSCGRLSWVRGKVKRILTGIDPALDRRQYEARRYVGYKKYLIAKEPTGVSEGAAKKEGEATQVPGHSWHARNSCPSEPRCGTAFETDPAHDVFATFRIRQEIRLP